MRFARRHEHRRFAKQSHCGFRLLEMVKQVVRDRFGLRSHERSAEQSFQERPRLGQISCSTFSLSFKPANFFAAAIASSSVPNSSTNLHFCAICPVYSRPPASDSNSFTSMLRPGGCSFRELAITILHGAGDDFLRSEAEYGSSDVIQPLLRPRLMTSVVIPILSYRPFIAILPEMTPIEPVSVPGLAEDLRAAHRNVIPAAGCNVAHAGDDRFFGFDAGDFAPHQIAGQTAHSPGLSCSTIAATLEFSSALRSALLMLSLPTVVLKTCDRGFHRN